MASWQPTRTVERRMGHRMAQQSQRGCTLREGGSNAAVVRGMQPGHVRRMRRDGGSAGATHQRWPAADAEVAAAARRMEWGKVERDNSTGELWRRLIYGRRLNCR
ncbi:hypothetical protein D1007_27823 [Hordeum vulgare]|nr:hypothetical protein D1007_27823 [Hordeum vulgare]KAI4987767.1 hypothetical protein ZWY2020_028525 [Hordeum vulgare]